MPLRLTSTERRPCSRMRCVDKVDCRTLRNLTGDALGIPIRQTYASVGCGLGHLAWCRRAVDAVSALDGEIDPHHADRIIRPGLDFKWLAGVHALEMIVGIVSIIWILIDLGNLERSGRRWFLFASHGRRIEADQRVGMVEQFDSLPALVDLDPVRFRRRLA